MWRKLFPILFIMEKCEKSGMGCKEWENEKAERNCAQNAFRGLHAGTAGREASGVVVPQVQARTTCMVSAVWVQLCWPRVIREKVKTSWGKTMSSRDGECNSDHALQNQGFWAFVQSPFQLMLFQHTVLEPCCSPVMHQGWRCILSVCHRELYNHHTCLCVLSLQIPMSYDTSSWQRWSSADVPRERRKPCENEATSAEVSEGEHFLPRSSFGGFSRLLCLILISSSIHSPLLFIEYQFWNERDLDAGYGCLPTMTIPLPRGKRAQQLQPALFPDGVTHLE